MNLAWLRWRPSEEAKPQHHWNVGLRKRRRSDTSRSFNLCRFADGSAPAFGRAVLIFDLFCTQGSRPGLLSIAPFDKLRAGSPGLGRIMRTDPRRNREGACKPSRDTERHIDVVQERFRSHRPPWQFRGVVVNKS